MRRNLLTLGLLLLGLQPALAQTDWQVVKAFPIGGQGGWDYLTVDSAARRLYRHDKGGRKAEAYTKKTCLWTGNGFVMPPARRVEPSGPSPIHMMPPSPERGDLRSMTPEGFALAVFEANAR